MDEMELGQVIGGWCVRKAQDDLDEIHAVVGRNRGDTLANLLAAYGWAATCCVHQVYPAYALAINKAVMVPLLAFLTETNGWDFETAQEFVIGRMEGYVDATAQGEPSINIGKYFWVCCHYPRLAIAFDQIVDDPDIIAKAWGDYANKDAITELRKAIEEQDLLKYMGDPLQDMETGVAILAFGTAVQDTLSEGG